MYTTGPKPRGGKTSYIGSHKEISTFDQLWDLGSFQDCRITDLTVWSRARENGAQDVMRVSAEAKKTIARMMRGVESTTLKYT
eukprot:2995819-Heterocapsa_arctica.AAC.1